MLSRSTKSIFVQVTQVLMLLICSLATSTNAVEQEPIDNPSFSNLEELLSLIADEGSKEIQFREQQVNPLLDSLIESEGTLVYDVEKRSLLKTVIHPEPSSFLMDDTGVLITRNGEELKLSNRRSGQLRALFTSIRGLLEGDKAQIETFFDIDFSQDASTWLIQLIPSNKTLAKNLEVIEIRGEANLVNSIFTKAPNGNEQTMWLYQSIMPEESEVP